MSITEAPITGAQSASGRYRTAAEWWEALGEVPLERIVFDPWPGSATEADIIRLEDKQDRLCAFAQGEIAKRNLELQPVAALQRLEHSARESAARHMPDVQLRAVTLAWRIGHREIADSGVLVDLALGLA